MPRVFYDYDIKKDKRNILRVLTSVPVFDSEKRKKIGSGLPKELTQKISKEKNINIKEKIIEEYLTRHFKISSLIKNKIKKFNIDWEKINNEYFNKLEKILNIKIYNNNYIGYLTNANSCPFNAKEKWFMVRLSEEKVDTLTAHEIMHIEFVRSYGFYCRDIGLSSQQFDILRESLTVLLNEEMEDILSILDYGYDEHKKYRDKIISLWKKDKNLKSIIDKSTDFIKL